MDKKQKVNETASLIGLVFLFCSQLDIEFLKEFREDSQKQHSTYEAIGIMEPQNYFDNCGIAEAKLKRLEALINLIQTLRDTNFDATKECKHSEDLLKNYQF